MADSIPTVLSSIFAWLGNIDDGYIEAWSNRGLLRRGRKLADRKSDATVWVSETACHSKFEGHRQSLDGAGFDYLSCSCPAMQTCHHLVALLLCLKTHPALAETESSVRELHSTETELAPWLAESFETISGQLGKRHLDRARRLLLQCVEVSLQTTPSGLLAEMNDGELQTVRIPRAVGLDGSLCTCGKERCVHRAVVVLAARMEAELYHVEEDLDDALGNAQQTVVSQFRDWLRELVAQGSAGLSQTCLDQGAALATVARQADLPAVGRSANGLLKVLRDELQGRSSLGASDLRVRVAPLWARITALSKTPLPQPLLQLAGQHRQQYRLVRNLELIGVGAEAWQSAGGYLGLSMHLVDPVSGKWYRHTQARRVGQSRDGWSPEHCWEKLSWASSLPYSKLPGTHLRLVQGWISGDDQVSGRDRTTLQIEADKIDPPFETSFACLRKRYAHQISDNPMAVLPAIPVVIAIHNATNPVFDSVSQQWRQHITDSAGDSLSMSITVNGAYPAQQRRCLDALWRKHRQWHRVFGFLVLNDSELSLRPVSVQTQQGVNLWQHLTLN